MEVELEKIGIQRENKILSIASLNPLVASIGERITEVCKKLAESGHRSLPVIDRKMQLRGIVSITDVFALLLSGGTMTSPVENIMSREVVRCGANETIEYVLQKMKISKRGRLPITSNNKLIGIVSEADFISAVKDASALDNIKIEEVMVRKPFFVAPSFSIKEVMRTMVNGKYRRLPIVENGKLVGYITSTLLFKHAVENSFSSSFLGKKVAEVMTKNPITVGKSEKLSSVLKKMKDRKVSSMLIVDEKNRLEGIFTERDFINLLV